MLYIYVCDSDFLEEKIKKICEIKVLLYFFLLCKLYVRYGINIIEGIIFFKELI